MLRSIHMKNFRTFRDTKIEPLKRVNLIAGKNDTGKTSLLEALRLLLDERGPTHCGNLPNEFRGGAGTGDWIENFWKWLFYNKDTRTVGEVRASLNGDKQFGIAFAVGG